LAIFSLAERFFLGEAQVLGKETHYFVLLFDGVSY